MLQATINPRSITPHPSNPRRDVGDVTDLAASIAARAFYEFVCVRCGRWYEYLSPKPASPTEALDARHELLQRIWDAAIEDTPSWQAALAEAQAQLTAEPSRGEA